MPNIIISLVDLDANPPLPEILEQIYDGLSFQADTEGVRKAVDGCGNMPNLEAQPTDTNPCARGIYWDFQEVARGERHRLFYGYHRSRRYFFIMREE